MNTAAKTAAEAEFEELAQIVRGEIIPAPRSQERARFPQSAIPILLPCEKAEDADGYVLTIDAGGGAVLLSTSSAEREVFEQHHIEQIPVKRVEKLPPLSRTEWREHFANVNGLLHAMVDGGKEQAIENVVKRINEPALKLNDTDNRMRYAAAALMNGLRDGDGGSGARFVVWIDRTARKIESGLLCDNPRIARFAKLATDAQFEWATCAWKRCAKGKDGARAQFAVDRWHRQKHCSTECKNAAASDAFRERKRATKHARSAKRRRSKAR